MLGFRDNEAYSSSFQRSGTQAGGVCVFAGSVAVVGAGLGCGVPGVASGMLCGGYVPIAWPHTEANFQ